MSALGGNPDGICSLRAFPLFTQPLKRPAAILGTAAPACDLQRKSVAEASVNAELLGRHFGPGNAVCYLLERDVARIVRRTVIRLGVDAEWREATIVGRAEALLV